MIFAAATISALAAQCAPNVAPQTVAAIVRTESRGNPFALNVNGGRQPAQQKNAADAASTAKRYVEAGYSVDLGLGQINSRNMRKLGLSWDTILDPCTNIAALGQILTQNYRSVAGGRHPQDALRLALSMYNTGNPSRGFSNGYVAKVVGNADVTDSSASGYADASRQNVNGSGARDLIVSENIAPQAHVRIERPSSPPPVWNVFERAAYVRKTLSQTASEERTILWTD